VEGARKDGSALSARARDACSAGVIRPRSDVNRMLPSGVQRPKLSMLAPVVSRRPWLRSVRWDAAGGNGPEVARGAVARREDATAVRGHRELARGEARGHAHGLVARQAGRGIDRDLPDVLDAVGTRRKQASIQSGPSRILDGGRRLC
jgi:hypothetical protein